MSLLNKLHSMNIHSLKGEFVNRGNDSLTLDSSLLVLVEERYFFWSVPCHTQQSLSIVQWV